MATLEKPLVESRFEDLLLDFLSYLEFERGLSRNTLEAYRGDLLQLGRFLGERHLSALEASPADISDFLTGLATGDDDHRPASPATIHRKSACLRSFYRHLRREGLRDSDPTASISGPRRGRRLPKVLNRGEESSASPSGPSRGRPRGAGGGRRSADRPPFAAASPAPPAGDRLPRRQARRGRRSGRCGRHRRG